MGNHPCLVLVEWELLLIPLGWPMTEQTESCLFSGSMTGRKREMAKSWEHDINSQTKQTKNCNKPRKFFFLPPDFPSFLSFTQQMLREWMWCQLLGKLITWHAARLNPANPIIYHPFRGPTVAIVTPSVSKATQCSDGKGEALYCGRGERMAEYNGGSMQNESVLFWCPSFLHSG